MSVTVGIDASVVASSSGGTRTYALQLLENLLIVRPDWSFVLYLRSDGEEKNLDALASSDRVRTPVVAGRPNAWRVQVALPGALDRDRVDLFHSLGYFLPLRWLGPKVVTVHDLNIYGQRRNWMRGSMVFQWLDLAVQTSLSVRAADRIITDSESSRDQIRRRFGFAAGKVRVIPLAADPFFSHKPADDELAAAKAIVSGKPFVLFVGILSPMKNLVALLRAYAASKLPAAGVRLVLAGSDREGYGATLRAEAESLRVADHVDMPGFVSEATLRALYWSALCVVLPSHGEGFGLPLVEGMAAGTPILAANRQSIPEVLGDSGVLFDPDDVSQLAGLLSRIGADEGYRLELATRARKGLDRFSWRRAAEATAAVYEEALSSRR